MRFDISQAEKDGWMVEVWLSGLWRSAKLLVSTPDLEGDVVVSVEGDDDPWLIFGEGEVRNLQPRTVKVPVCFCVFTNGLIAPVFPWDDEWDSPREEDVHIVDLKDPRNTVGKNLRENGYDPQTGEKINADPERC